MLHFLYNVYRQLSSTTSATKIFIKLNNINDSMRALRSTISASAVKIPKDYITHTDPRLVYRTFYIMINYFLV